MPETQTAVATPASALVLGVDVAKDTLALAWGSAPKAQVEEITNTKAGLLQVLRQLPKTTIVGLESTGRYHQLTCELARGLGLTVYLLNLKDVKCYGQSVGARAKTDVVDARIISRYVEHEQEHLHPYEQPPAQVARIDQLVRRRALLVSHRSSWRQHLGQEKLSAALRAGEKAQARMIKDTDAAIDACFAAEPALHARRKRLLTIPGVGPVVSAALTATLAGSRFASADALVAFIGLDLRVQDSGQHKGRRRLTKRGDPELRRLLFNAAMAVTKHSAWESHYQDCLKRGLSPIEALVVLARRIARTAWSMDHYGTIFSADRLFGRNTAAAPATSAAIPAASPAPAGAGPEVATAQAASSTGAVAQAATAGAATAGAAPAEAATPEMIAPRAIADHHPEDVESRLAVVAQAVVAQAVVAQARSARPSAPSRLGDPAVDDAGVADAVVADAVVADAVVADAVVADAVVAGAEPVPITTSIPRQPVTTAKPRRPLHSKAKAKGATCGLKRNVTLQQPALTFKGGADDATAAPL